LSVAFLAQCDAILSDKVKFVRAAAGFLSSNIRQNKDRAIIIGAAETTVILSDSTNDGFTDDPARFSKAIDRIRANPESLLYDAIYVTVQKKLAFEQPERRRLIVLVGNGRDVFSRYSLTEAINIAQRHDIAIYAISTNETADPGRPNGLLTQQSILQLHSDLEKMADATGGKVYLPQRSDDLATAFQQISDELQSQYFVSYSPTNVRLDGTYRKIEIEVTAGKYRAHTRAGYFASAQN
jgi:VWFA-related protein